MGRFVNPNNIAFQVALKSPIYFPFEKQLCSD